MATQGRIDGNFAVSTRTIITLFVGMSVCSFISILMTHMELSEGPERIPNLFQVSSSGRSLDRDDNESIQIKTENYLQGQTPGFPTLPRSQSDGVVHILHSRFMQYQPDLVDLGMARFRLFKTFCLPSILQQSTHEFLWIIRTDPSLNEKVKKAMIRLLEPHPRFLFVGSNSFYEGFRDAAAVVDLTEEAVFSGSLDLLRQVHAMAQNRIVIETKLDADDGLHYNFLETLRHNVVENMPSSSREQDDAWRVWCIGTHFEWHPEFPFCNVSHPASEDAPEGYLARTILRICVSAGTSVAYGVAANRSSIPTLAHHRIRTAIPRCGEKQRVHCWEILKGDINPAAIRPRTPSSAGMLRVVIRDEDHTTSNESIIIPCETDTAVPVSSPDIQYRTQILLWSSLNHTMAVERESVENLKSYMDRNRLGIAQDALKGDCDSGIGGTCRNLTRHALERFVEVAEHEAEFKESGEKGEKTGFAVP